MWDGEAMEDSATFRRKIKLGDIGENTFSVASHVRTGAQRAVVKLSEGTWQVAHMPRLGPILFRYAATVT